jgi:hypothetical protein
MFDHETPHIAVLIPPLLHIVTVQNVLTGQMGANYLS